MALKTVDDAGSVWPMSSMSRRMRKRLPTCLSVGLIALLDGGPFHRYVPATAPRQIPTCAAVCRSPRIGEHGPIIRYHPRPCTRVCGSENYLPARPSSAAGNDPAGVLTQDFRPRFADRDRVPCEFGPPYRSARLDQTNSSRIFGRPSRVRVYLPRSDQESPRHVLCRPRERGR
jgi:hypothetical protein